MFYGLDRQLYNEVINPINPKSIEGYSYSGRTFVTAPDGTDYTQMSHLQKWQTSQFDMSKAEAYKQQAISELSAQGVSFPIKLKFYSTAGNETEAVKARMLKEMIEGLGTDYVEVELHELEILNTSIDIPFSITDETTALEDTRLKYRYLDIRRNEIKDKLICRSKVTKAVRDYFINNDFLEIETPILCKSTPEGARDYLVPSRISKGKFYALPQSPQLFKQLLMVGGIERYFQIAKCFRDEDLRSDRQPEFTQIDMEMSFVNEEDIMNINEGLIAHVFKEIKNIDIPNPIPKMKYDDAIKYYGSDKPDLRFDMKINDITNIFQNTEFQIFQNIIKDKGIINALVVKNSSDKYSRKDLEKLNEFIKTYDANNLFYLKYNNELSGSIIKVMTSEEQNDLIKQLKLEENDLVLIVGGSYTITKHALGALRCKLAKDLNLIKKGDYAFTWIIDFPSFEYSEEEQRYVACHHPFTAPKDEDIDKLLTDKGNCYSKAYDLVINGYEIGGGSIRIHDNNIQNKMFQALELTEEDIKEKFGFFVEGLKYGTPPHGGLAFGLERLVMVLTETENVRDTIAFPKTASASCLMSEAPNIVDINQLKELGISINK